MNERIRQLAEQAEMAANKGDHVDVKIMMSKFAELIVGECAVIANRAENNDTEIRCMYDVITEHFGVK
jgi:hypothetical protein